MPRRSRIFDFQRLHHFGVAGAFMIVAGQMQHAMHHQMDGMIGEALAGSLRLRLRVTPKAMAMSPR